MVPDEGPWKRKTGQKAGLEGFQSIQRNAVELDVVPETGTIPEQKTFEFVGFRQPKPMAVY
ncbi:MAG: hypothetical protein E6R08_11250 [Nevskiaceae bacterium]|nr:MAG: hypothetical protein E6R08_11250 [Nevskiaceae bacterium]